MKNLIRRLFNFDPGSVILCGANDWISDIQTTQSIFRDKEFLIAQWKGARNGS